MLDVCFLKSRQLNQINTLISPKSFKKKEPKILHFLSLPADISLIIWDFFLIKHSTDLLLFVSKCGLESCQSRQQTPFDSSLKLIFLEWRASARAPYIPPDLGELRVGSAAQSRCHLV